MTPGSRPAIALVASRAEPSQVSAAPPSRKRQGVTTSVLVFVSACAGVYTQAVLAATLGLSGASDAYFAALGLCLFATYVVNTSILNREVPHLARLLDPAHVPTPAFWSRVWQLSRRLTLICAAMCVLLLFGADWAIGAVAPGLTGDTHRLAVLSLQVMSVPLAIQLSGSALIAAQYAVGGQPLIQSTALLYSLAVVTSLVALTPRFGPISAAIGAGVSFCLMLLVVATGTLHLFRRPASSYEPPVSSGGSTSVTLVTVASIVLFGQTLVGPLIASTLAEGAVAQLAFAYRPIDVLARAVPVVIAYTVMPGLATAYARRDRSAVRAHASEALRITFSLVLPIAALLAAVREPLVSMLYQRSAFSVEAAASVADALAWFAAGLPALSIVVVLNAIFFSIGRQRLALLMGIAMLGLYVALGFALGQALGGAGVALAFCVCNVAVALGAMAMAGERNAQSLLRAVWFRWSVLAAVLALIGGSAGVEVTHALPTLVRLTAGVMLGGIGPLLAILRAQVLPVRYAPGWLISTRS